MYDTDVAQLGTKIAESSLWPNLSVQGSVQRQWENDPTLSAKGNDIASVISTGPSSGSSQRPHLRHSCAGWRSRPKHHKRKWLDIAIKLHSALIPPP